MTIVIFTIQAEIKDEENMETSQIDQTLSDMEDLVSRHYDLYDSEWYYED